MTPSEGADWFRTSSDRRPSIMGILNVTPDSFYDGGATITVGKAVSLAARMLDEGASIIDVGGESTRPGHEPIGTQQELDRICPVVEAIAKNLDTPISIDTTKAAVARGALEFGAHIVNDIWGLQGDPAMPGVIAEFDAGAVVMHNRSEIDVELDIFDDIHRFLSRSLRIASDAGINCKRLTVDPGIGFGKTPEQNLQVISGVDKLKDLGLPVLIGVSRKSFIGATIDNPETDRLPGTIAANLRAIEGGARIIRVHDVGAHAQALRIWEATGP